MLKVAYWKRAKLKVAYWKRAKGGWFWATTGWDDGVLRLGELEMYKTRKALFSALDTFDTYASWIRVRIADPDPGGN